MKVATAISGTVLAALASAGLAMAVIVIPQGQAAARVIGHGSPGISRVSAMGDVTLQITDLKARASAQAREAAEAKDAATASADHKFHLAHLSHLRHLRYLAAQAAAEAYAKAHPAPVTLTVSASAPIDPSPAPAPAPAPASSYSGSGGLQSCIISRESGGNPQIWNPSGHWGLYQFAEGTWVANGGPASEFGNASAAEQTRIFWNTVANDGYSPWEADGCPGT